MSNIIIVNADTIGEVGVEPRIVQIQTTSDYTAITTLNWIAGLKQQGIVLSPTDVIFISYLEAGVVAFGMFTPLINSTGITMVPFEGSTPIGTAGFKDATDNSEPLVASTSGVFTPGNLVIAADALGTIADSGATLSSQTPFVAAVNGATVVGNLPAFDDVNGTLVDSGAALTDPSLARVASVTSDVFVPGKTLVASDAAGTIAPGSQFPILTTTVNATFAALAAGGEIPLVGSAGAQTYLVLDLFINEGGTNFSGGGGDRNLSVTDNTTTWSIVPAATLQAEVNGRWGTSTDLPLPSGFPAIINTAAGDSLVAKYSGGTTDYTAGSIDITVVYQRQA